MIDMINSPPHYTAGKIEVIDFLEDQKLDLHLGSVVKYICRAPHKGSFLSDLKKAQWYLNRRIWLEESNAKPTDPRDLQPHITKRVRKGTPKR